MTKRTHMSQRCGIDPIFLFISVNYYRWSCRNFKADKRFKDSRNQNCKLPSVVPSSVTPTPLKMPRLLTMSRRSRDSQLLILIKAFWNLLLNLKFKFFNVHRIGSFPFYLLFFSSPLVGNFPDLNPAFVLNCSQDLSPPSNVPKVLKVLGDTRGGSRSPV